MASAKCAACRGKFEANEAKISLANEDVCEECHSVLAHSEQGPRVIKKGTRLVRLSGILAAIAGALALAFMVLPPLGARGSGLLYHPAPPGALLNVTLTSAAPTGWPMWGRVAGSLVAVVELGLGLACVLSLAVGRMRTFLRRWSPLALLLLLICTLSAVSDWSLL